VVKLIEKPDTLEHRKAALVCITCAKGRAVRLSICAGAQNPDQNANTTCRCPSGDIDQGAHFVIQNVAVWEDSHSRDRAAHQPLSTGSWHAQPAEGIQAPLYRRCISPSRRSSRTLSSPLCPVGEMRASRSIMRDSNIESGARSKMPARTLARGRNAALKGRMHQSISVRRRHRLT
jgi:hypothetical protein